jgi:hypothetical protein
MIMKQRSTKRTTELTMGSFRNRAIGWVVTHKIFGCVAETAAGGFGMRYVLSMVWVLSHAGAR